MLDISIIVPFRNSEDKIKNCLENLTKVNYEKYEIILVNDGSEKQSTQISEKIIKEYKEREKIRYYYIDKTSEGVGEARNYGIDRASGRYIMFVDVDDKIESDLLMQLQQYIDEGIEMIKYKMKFLYKDNEKKDLRKNEETKAGPIFNTTSGENAFNKLCYKDNFFDSPCLYLIKKELFERTNLRFPQGIYHEDFALIPLLIINAKTVVSTKFYGYNYIQTLNSIIRNSDYKLDLKKVNDKFWAYDNMIKEIEKMNISKKTRNNIKKYYTNSILMCLKNLKTEDRQVFEQKIRKSKMEKNIKCNNLKQIIKRILLNINIEWYLKLIKD